MHRNGVITDGDLRKGIRMLKEPSETPTEVPSKTEAPSSKSKTVKQTCQTSLKEESKAIETEADSKQARQKHEQRQKAVMDELKQVYSQREKKV